MSHHLILWLSGEPLYEEIWYFLLGSGMFHPHAPGANGVARSGSLMTVEAARLSC